MIVTRTAFRQLNTVNRFLKPSFSIDASGEPTFLNMVEGYFNRAARTAGI